jgi:tRNA A58 N-methylase Trm61
MSSPESSHYTKPIIEEGDVIVLWTSDNRSRTVRVLANVNHQTHLGDLALKELIGRQVGLSAETQISSTRRTSASS